MDNGKYILGLKKALNSGGKKLDLSKAALLSIAIGEKLPSTYYDGQQLTQAFSGLRRYKFVRREKGKNHSLTTKGKEKLQDIIIDEIKIQNKKWNGKWYLVMYDFPIRLKKARNAFRWKLKDLGFFQLQKSAWIYPYPCTEEILLVADFYGVRGHIEILEVSKVLNEKKLKAHFCL